MYKEMRRKDRQLDQDQAKSILEQALFGYLATSFPDGTPYVVPVNHVYIDDHIVFHCAREGQKLDNLKTNPKVCYAVTTNACLVPEKITTKYESAIAFGTAEIVTEPTHKKELLTSIMTRLAPGVPFSCDDAGIERTTVVRIKIHRMTGKANE